MNISGMGSSAMYGGMQAMQKPSSSEMAEDLFSNIDTEGKGYIEEADLESAMSNLGDSSDMMSSEEMFELLDSDGDGKVTQSELTSSFDDMATEMSVRMQGGMPPPPPPEDEGLTEVELAELAESSDDSVISDLFSQLAENFDEADTNGDGTVSSEEAMNYQQSTSSDSAAEEEMAAGQMPPPPPPGGMGEAPSYTAEELAELAESTDDTTMANLFSQLAENFDEADTNGDGTVSSEEAMNFEQASASSTSTSADEAAAQPVNAQLMRTITELVNTYKASDSSSSSFTASA